MWATRGQVLHRPHPLYSSQNSKNHSQSLSLSLAHLHDPLHPPQSPRSQSSKIHKSRPSLPAMECLQTPPLVPNIFGKSRARAGTHVKPPDDIKHQYQAAVKFTTKTLDQDQAFGMRVTTMTQEFAVALSEVSKCEANVSPSRNVPRGVLSVNGPDSCPSHCASSLLSPPCTNRNEYKPPPLSAIPSQLLWTNYVPVTNSRVAHQDSHHMC